MKLLIKKNCKTCALEFLTNRPHKLWCSGICKNTWRRSQYPAKYRHGEGVFAKDPKIYRLKWHFEKKYGITLEQYNEMVEGQNGVCAICNKAPTGTNHTTSRLAVDHDHATGVVRGLLCGTCNTTIGLIEDNPVLLEKMKRYLWRHAQLQLTQQSELEKFRAGA